MIAPRFGAHSVLGACVLGLICVTLVGGVLMAVAEGIAYDKRLWTVFNVVTSIGLVKDPRAYSVAS